MIKKLRIKFICIIMTILTVVLLCIFGAINITMYKSTNRQTLETLTRIAHNDGQMRPVGRLDFPIDAPRDSMEYPTPQLNFSVKLDTEGNILEILSDRSQVYAPSDVQNYLDTALQSNTTYGNIGNLKYLSMNKDYGQIIVFLDNSMQINATARLFWITLTISCISLIAIFIIALFLSDWAIKPVKKTYEAQKLFIADASHELKTPLTIISANVDVLVSNMGESKWLSFIKEEVLRMSQLVNNLLYLAKSDAAQNAYALVEYNLSEVLNNVALPFESTCFEEHKKLTFGIQENVIHKGDKHRLAQVIVILLDNAVKNTNENGEIVLSLYQQNGKKVITVYNTGHGITPLEKEKIFDRFYRGDSSRERKTGGYGLGLPIAKTIIDAHKGKILVDSEYGQWAKFTILL